jgi:hypothetical protein
MLEARRESKGEPVPALACAAGSDPDLLLIFNSRQLDIL